MLLPIHHSNEEAVKTPPSLGGVEWPYGPGDKRLPQSVCGAGLRQHSAIGYTLLPSNYAVQWVAGIVHDGQQFVKGHSLCHWHKGIQLHANHRASSPHQPALPHSVPLLNVAFPAHHSIEENAGDNQHQNISRS